jgi:glycosyltransferase involved in cell wall biosynthesis
MFEATPACGQRDTEPSASVVVPARDAAGTIAWTLDGLEHQDFEGLFEVILVDDGSTDETADLALASSLEVRLLRLAGVGAAEARNAGAALGQGHIAFLDADCRPSRSWLREGLKALEAASLVLGTTLPDPSTPVGPFDRTLWVRPPSALFESANLFVRRDLFEDLGGFRSWLRPRRGRPFGEDVLFGWRARRSGARIGSSEAALVHHAVFPRSALEYIRERLRLRFFPPMARHIPELRSHFFYRRSFLSRRTAAFDAAACGLVAAVISRRPLGLVAAAPYAVSIRPRVSGGAPRHGAKMICVEGLADAIGLAALIFGSVRSRSLVL